MSSASESSSRPINLHISAEMLVLIDGAADLLGKSRTEFICDAACDKAREVLANRTQFALGSEQLASFNRLLDAPLSYAVVKLLNTRAPWES